MQYLEQTEDAQHGWHNYCISDTLGFLNYTPTALPEYVAASTAAAAAATVAAAAVQHASPHVLMQAAHGCITKIEISVYTETKRNRNI
jgi:hypothetical protein